MISTSKLTRKAGVVLLFLLGFGMGWLIRRFLIPLETTVVNLMYPWILGDFLILVILGGVLAAFAVALYRSRHRNFLVTAPGWGIWAGFLVHSLLIFALMLLIFKGGITPVG